jgi:hypothetical protein
MSMFQAPNSCYTPISHFSSHNMQLLCIAFYHHSLMPIKPKLSDMFTEFKTTELIILKSSSNAK